MQFKVVYYCNQSTKVILELHFMMKIFIEPEMEAGKKRLVPCNYFRQIASLINETMRIAASY